MSDLPGQPAMKVQHLPIRFAKSRPCNPPALRSYAVNTLRPLSEHPASAVL